MTRRWTALLVPLVVLLTAPFLVHYLPQLTQQVKKLGIWAPVAYPLIYGGAMMASIPCLPLALGAGAWFGSALGVLVVLVGELLGASGGYLMGRVLGGESVREWAARHPRLLWLEPLLRKEGGLVVGMSHLIPGLPFNLINYVCGLMRVPFRGFLFWTGLGVLPWTSLSVLGADLVAEALRGGPVRPVIVAIAAALGVVIVVLLHLARRRLQR